MKLQVQKVIDDITDYMQAAGKRGHHEASNAYDNAIGKVSGLLHIYQSDDPFLLNFDYINYRPGMKIVLQQELHDHIEVTEVLEIAKVNGYDLPTDTYHHPKDGDLHFITTEGLKIVWNQVAISCFIELDQTTTFLKEMFNHYRNEAERRLNEPKYDWDQRDYDQYIKDKNDQLLEMLIVNEHKRCESVRQWNLYQTQIG